VLPTLLLSALLLAAALGLALRLGWSGRAELGLATGLLGAGLVVVPLQLLGWLGWLRPIPVAAAALALGGGILAATTGDRARARELLRAAGALARLPGDAGLELLRSRSFALVGLAAVSGILPYTALVSYLAPDGSWDGLWYHQSIVGFALQNGGFALVDVPPSLEMVNGYPRCAELLSLWLVLFWDRRLVELVPTLAAPLFLLALYLLARRFAPRRIAVGLACALLLTPGAILQLCSTYNDLTAAAFFLAALHFGTRPQGLRGRDAAMAGLALGLLAGTKGTGVVWAPLLAVAPFGRIGWRLLRERSRGASSKIASELAPGLAAGLLLAVAIPGPVYLRNWVVHRNPVWPVDVEVLPLGLHWPGPNREALHQGRGWRETLASLYEAPHPGLDFHDERNNSYGLGLPWLLLPLWLAALPAAIGTALRGSRERRDRALQALLLVAPCAVALALSPALWWCRFNLPAVAGASVLLAWAFGGRWARFGEGALGATVVSALLLLGWASPAWDTPLPRVLELLRMDTAARAVEGVVSFSIEPRVARARERELGPGDVVALDEPIGLPAALWNERFSNRLVYLPAGDGRGYLDRLDAAGAKWAATVVGGPGWRALRAEPLRWRELGLSTRHEEHVAAFSRTR
jgi:hypothetical protein